MNDKRRIVITGLGMVSALGADLEKCCESLTKREHVLKSPSFYDASQDRPKVFSVPESIEFKQFIKKRKSLKIMSRTLQIAVAASRIAFDDSSLLDDQEFEPEKTGVSAATGIMDYDLEEMFPAMLKSCDQKAFNLKAFGEEGHDALFPLWALKYIPNMPACHISIENNLRGPSNTHSGSNASGFQSLNEAVRIIRRGDAKAMIVAASEARLHPLGLAHMENQGLFKEGTFQPGEAGAAMILESYDEALKRKAHIYAEVLGVAVNHDVGDGQMLETMKRCFKRALREAQLEASDIDFIVLNQCGLKNIDEKEEAAIKSLFCGDLEKPTLKMKNFFGYTGHASGLLEACVSMFALKQDDLKALEVMSTKSLKKKKIFMINAFGLYGHFGSVILRKFEEEINA